MTKLVFPTPGLPSKRMALFSCIALNKRSVLNAVVGAAKEYDVFSGVLFPSDT